MKDRKNFFRHVYLFKPGNNYGNGRLLFSFAPQVTPSDGNRVTLDAREPMIDSGVRQASYFASCLSEGDSVKVIIERDISPPLVFLKMLSSMGWLLIDEDDEQLISHDGCHSLNMLVSEVVSPSRQEH